MLRPYLDDGATCGGCVFADGQYVWFDDAFVPKQLAPNVLHPYYRRGYVLCGGGHS